MHLVLKCVSHDITGNPMGMAQRKTDLSDRQICLSIYLIVCMGGGASKPDIGHEINGRQDGQTRVFPAAQEKPVCP